MSTESYNGFRFRYVHDTQSTGAVKVYVENQPSYGSRDRSPQITHCDPGRNGAPPTICFKEGNKPKTHGDAQRLARDWADRTQTYIRTGVSISDQFRR